MRSRGMLVAVVGLGWALAGCASFATRPYKTSNSATCTPASREDGAPAGSPADGDCLRNGITYYELMPALVTSRLNSAVNGDGHPVACRTQEVREYKLLPDPERRMVLEHHPGLFGDNALNVAFREDGTLASIGLESTSVPTDLAVEALKSAAARPGVQVAIGPRKDSRADEPTVSCTGSPSLVSVTRVKCLAQFEGKACP